MGFDVELLHRVGIVDARWEETIRYHKNIAYRHELQIVEEACQWFIDNRYVL